MFGITGAREIVVCDGSDGAIDEAETGVSVTLSRLVEAILWSCDRVRGDLSSSAKCDVGFVSILARDDVDECESARIRFDSDPLVKFMDDVFDDVGISEIFGPTPKLRASNSTGFLLNCSNASFSS